MKQYKLFALAIVITLQCVLIGCTGTGSGASGSAAADSTIAEATMAEQERAEQQRLEQEKAEQERLEQEKAEQQRLEEEKAKQQSLVGTYQIDDGHLGPIILTVNEDETATMRYKGDDVIWYGSWYKNNNMECANFHFDGEEIYVGRPNVVPQLYIGGTSKFLRDFVLVDGYLYTSFSAARAKNPNERLKFQKVS